MKTKLKKCLSGFLVLTILAGIIPNVISFSAIAQTEEVVSNSACTYLTFEDYRTAYEELPKSTSAWVLGRTQQVDTMDEVEFKGDIIFSAEGSSTDCTLIIGGNYLSVNEDERDRTASGIGLYISGGRMYAYNHYVKDDPQSDIGTASAGYPNRVSIQFKKVEDGLWNVTYTVNGVTTEPISYEQSCDFGPYLQIRPNANKEGEVNCITCNSVQEGYTYLSFHDFRIEGSNVAAENDWTSIPDEVATTCRAATTHVNTLDKVIFQGQVTFSVDEQDFTIGGITQATTGETITSAGNSLSKYDHGIYFYIKDSVLYAGNYYRPHDTKIKICAATLGTPLNMKLQFDQLELGKWQVSYTINGATGTLNYTNLYPDGQGYYYDFGPQIFMRTKTGTISIASVTGDNPVEVEEARYYNLADGPYLVSGTAVVKKVGGQTILTTPNENPIIEAAGDYIITTTEGSFSKEQQVSLYAIGDLNGDSACDSSDYAKLSEILHYTKVGDMESYVRPYKADSAAEYAADLNNNGKVDKQDLDLLKAIVNEKSTTLEKVLKKYHVPSVSYDYLGGKDVMPIVGFYGPYVGPLGQAGYNFLTDDIYQKIKTLGVNLITDSPNRLGDNTGTRYVYQQLQLAEKYGIGQLVYDLSLNPELGKDSNGKYIEIADTAGPTIQELATQIGKYSYFGSYLGTYVRDEPYFYYPEVDNPTATDISEHNKQLKYFDWIAKKMNQFTNNLGFINSVGTGSESIFATSYMHGVKNFKEGLEAILNRTDAKVLSYTSYPFSGTATLDNANHDGTACPKDSPVDGKGCSYQTWQYYYRDLWSIREVALENNGTFWVYTAAGGDFRDNASTAQTDSEKLPTEQETYWDINHKLAFGAKGINYFTLLQPWYFVQDETQEEGFDYNRSGLIDLNGNLTTYGTYAVDINKHIGAIDDVLMRSSSKGIIATGATTIKRVTSDGDVLLSKGTNKLASVSGDTTNGYGALVGCFDYGDTEAFYVMNYSLDTKQSFTLHFREACNYRYVSEALDYTGTGATLTLSDIEPGRGVLVVLDEADVRYTDGADEVLYAELTDMSASGKNITFYTDSVESLYGSSAQEIITFAYDTDAVFLNGNAIWPKITEVNEHGVWGFQLDMSDIVLAEGDLICLRGTVYPTSGNNRGRLTEVMSQYYMWTNGAWVELPGYYDVAAYKDADATEKYPTQTGKVFAGWFADSTYETPYTASEGFAYAKFVDAGVMANLAQIPMDVTFDTVKTKMRFVSTVDSLNYSQVGFVLQLEGSTKGPVEIVTKNVYKEIVAAESGVEFTKKPTDIHASSKYFFTYTLTDIGTELFDREIYVTPFWVTLDGTKVYGERKVKTVENGIVVNRGENNDYDEDDVLGGGKDDEANGSGGFTEVEDPESGYGSITR